MWAMQMLDMTLVVVKQFSFITTGLLVGQAVEYVRVTVPQLVLGL